MSVLSFILVLNYVVEIVLIC